jgi:hypothetical protein
MKILQFLCPLNPPAEQLKAIMLEQVNTWSRLQRLASDPEYTTQPFDMSIWHEHTATAGLWWMDYDSVYANIGDDGRKIADQMFEPGPLTGILLHAPLVLAMPNMKLQLVDVADPVAAGYLPEPQLLSQRFVA